MTRTARSRSSIGAGQLRILGGRWRGRKLSAPTEREVRPTAQRTREMLFNRLMHGFASEPFNLANARVVDVCAGSGALGLEALSRGAAHATFIECAPEALKLLAANIAALAAEDVSQVIAADARALPVAPRPCDLALLDPPYGKDLVRPILRSLRAQHWLRPGALVCIETSGEEEIAVPEGFAFVDRRTVGRAAITTLRRH